MLNEDKISKVLELLRASSPTSDKQKEWFVKLSDMKCAGMTDECILEFIEELLGEIDAIVETESEADVLRRSIDALEEEICALEEDNSELESDVESLQSDIEDKDSEIEDLRLEISKLEDEIENLRDSM